MILDSEQLVLDFINDIKADAAANNVSFIDEFHSKFNDSDGSSDRQKIDDLFYVYGPSADSPNLTVIAAFEQNIDSEYHTGLV